MGGAGDHPFQYFAASAMAATLNYPLWRSAAIGQSGFKLATMTVGGVTIPSALTPFFYGFLPPYKGMAATVIGMTWARAAIFWTSDYTRDFMIKAGFSETSATVAPPLVVGTAVQLINQPIVRSTVTLQDPKHNFPNVLQSLKHIYSTHGAAGLWHGTEAAVLKTVPKYCIAIAVKDFMESTLPLPDENSPTYETDRLWRSAIKSGAAGVAGAALTNPLDVIRNEMFKTNLSISTTVKQLYEEQGYGFMTRGMTKNVIAVAMPVGMTIFFTDALIQWSQEGHLTGAKSH